MYEEKLARVLVQHAWDNIPEDKKGSEKVLRRATPGGWREELTPEQFKIVETMINAPLLKEFYSEMAKRHLQSNIVQGLTGSGKRMAHRIDSPSCQ